MKKKSGYKSLFQNKKLDKLFAERKVPKIVQQNGTEWLLKEIRRDKTF